MTGKYASAYARADSRLKQLLFYFEREAWVSDVTCDVRTVEKRGWQHKLYLFGMDNDRAATVYCDRDECDSDVASEV